MTRITSEGMRKVAHNLRTNTGSQFVCIEAMRVHIPYRHGAEWRAEEAVLKATLHTLLRRDGKQIDGCWRDQQNDENYTDFCNAKRQERIEWCEKIASELSLQEMYHEALSTG